MEESCEFDVKEKLKSDQESSLLSCNNFQSCTEASLAKSEYQRFQELPRYFKEQQTQFCRMLKSINDIARNLWVHIITLHTIANLPLISLCNPKLSNQEFERLYLEFTNN